MSAARPYCSVCIDPQIKLIDKKFHEGSGAKIVRRWLVTNRVGGRLPLFSVSTLKLHRVECLGLAPKVNGAPRGGPPVYLNPDPIPGVETEQPEKPREPIVTPDDPGERAKMIEQLLYSSLADLSAKDLYNLHMRELDLKIAQENRLAKETAAPPPPSASTRTDDPTGFDEAMARAGGHRPELRVVKKSKAS